MEKEEEEQSMDSSSADDEEEDDEEEIESLVRNRERRRNAGTRMAQLLETADEDAFYKSTYGGFYEEDDENFDSPVESDGDEVDSDFDRSEPDEEEPASDEEKRRPSRTKRVGRGELRVHKKWLIPRLSSFATRPRPVNPFSQEELLDEAKSTEKRNKASLELYERLALEQRAVRATRARPGVALGGASIRSLDSRSHRLLILPSLPISKSRPRPMRAICVVTGKPARYKDPLTGLPYVNRDAFQTIRAQYQLFLQERCPPDDA